ncbi:MAG: SurA N-terminal domain-containing protein [Thermodesulfovibrionales bacterium]
MKTLAKALISIMIFAAATATVSCSRDKASPKGGAERPPEQSKLGEAYKKGVVESKKNTVATVNGVEISMYALVSEMNTIAPEYVKPGQKKDPQVDEKVRKNALDRLIVRELAVQEAQRTGMKPSPERLAEELKKLKADLKSEQAYKDKLAQSGITEDELKKQLERSLLVEMITEAEIFGKANYEPGQVKKTYEKRKSSYKGPSGKPMSFEEARPLIEQELMTAAVHKREDAWVEELKKRARIQITMGESAKGIHSVQ